MSKVDLHIHTIASDGKFSAEEIVSRAHEIGLNYIAITDHDSIEGVAPAQEAATHLSGITVIGGVEINTDTPSGELHILGYLCDCENQELKDTLERLRSSRIERAKKMVNKLRSMGLKIDYGRVEELAGVGSVGRPHVAQALLEKGYIYTFKEAFSKYIGYGGPAYVERDKITPAGAVGLILKSHGVPVLAHPFTGENPESIVSMLKPAGLMGIEVYYGSYTAEQVQTLLALATQYNLVPTGGSDFHGLDGIAEPQLGTVEVPLESALQLLELAKK
jgi:3',5'-nucleoside bisphosphate phosphatase